MSVWQVCYRHLSFTVASSSLLGRNPHVVRTTTAAVAARNLPNARSTAWRGLSSSSSNDNNNNDSPPKSFRPRRQTSSKYRPVSTKKVSKKTHRLGKDHQVVQLEDTSLESPYGTFGAQLIQTLRDQQQHGHPDEYFNAEEDLRTADYFTAQSGSTEEKAYERRALAHLTEEQRKQFYEDIDDAIAEGEKYAFQPDNELMRDDIFEKNEKKDYLANILNEDEEEQEMEYDDDEEDPRDRIDDNQVAFGEWSELLIGVNRSVKLWRGGRMESYRALMIGGNMNGCGGFGIGKSPNAIKAVTLAGRMAKRNVFFVDRYMGDGLTHDLVGKQNSCKVILRATHNGLRGNELCTEILKRFGIVNAVCKAHGNRHPWNVVRATFKALVTHESIEDIALKRGKRLVSLDRVMRMKL